MAAAKRGPEGYGLAPQFERLVAALACARPAFFGVVGHELDPARMSDPAARLAVLAAQAHAKDAGRGPAAPALVLQRAQRWHGEGKHTVEEVCALMDLLLEVDVDSVDERAAAAELVPVLQRTIRNEAVVTAIEDYGKGGDFARVEEMIRRAKSLGLQDHSTGSKLGVGALKDIKRLRGADRLSTGILELDVGLSGGLPRGKAAMIVGGAKAGKSMYLTQQCAVALHAGLFTAKATLELSEEDQHTRLIAHLTGIPIDVITEGSQEAEVQERLEDLLPTLGVYRCKFFPAKVTTMGHIVEWVHQIEQEEGRKVDLLALDYVDKLGIDDRRITSSYDIQGQSMEEFRLYCHGRGIWGWTGSQPKRRDAKEKNRRIGIDDIADSQNKVRVADLILTMHRPSDAEVEFYVAGNRGGRDQFSVGPFAHNLSCAQLVPSVGA